MKLRYGAVVGIAEPGLNFKIPFVDTVRQISVQNQAIVYERVEAYSKDQQPATLRISVSYRVPEASVEELYSQYGTIDSRSRPITARMMPTTPRRFGRVNGTAGRFILGSPDVDGAKRASAPRAEIVPEADRAADHQRDDDETSENLDQDTHLAGSPCDRGAVVGTNLRAIQARIKRCRSRVGRCPDQALRERNCSHSALSPRGRRQSRSERSWPAQCTAYFFSPAVTRTARRFCGGAVGQTTCGDNAQGGL